MRQVCGLASVDSRDPVHLEWGRVPALELEHSIQSYFGDRMTIPITKSAGAHRQVGRIAKVAVLTQGSPQVYTAPLVEMREVKRKAPLFVTVFLLLTEIMQQARKWNAQIK